MMSLKWLMKVKVNMRKDKRVAYTWRVVAIGVALGGGIKASSSRVGMAALSKGKVDRVQVARRDPRSCNPTTGNQRLTGNWQGLSSQSGNLEIILFNGLRLDSMSRQEVYRREDW